MRSTRKITDLCTFCLFDQYATPACVCSLLCICFCFIIFSDKVSTVTSQCCQPYVLCLFSQPELPQLRNQQQHQGLQASQQQHQHHAGWKLSLLQTKQGKQKQQICFANYYSNFRTGNEVTCEICTVINEGLDETLLNNEEQG